MPCVLRRATFNGCYSTSTSNVQGQSRPAGPVARLVLKRQGVTFRWSAAMPNGAAEPRHHAPPHAVTRHHTRWGEGGPHEPVYQPGRSSCPSLWLTDRPRGWCSRGVLLGTQGGYVALAGNVGGCGRNPPPQGGLHALCGLTHIFAHVVDGRWMAMASRLLRVKLHCSYLPFFLSSFQSWEMTLP